EEKEELLVDLAKQAVFEDEADVVVLAGAPLSGLAAKVRDRIPVPVVDCAEAAMKQAEALASLRPRAPEAGSFRRPAPKPSIGVSQRLADRIAHV
ncbi:MAG: hydrogenase expression protein HupH, partial [Rhodobacteraceae bacterium]|nr:hydrogenase expression protein HupH [Paracoccaceae bacterium]